MVYDGRQGDELDVKKRLNVLEMMKEFRTNMDISDDDDKDDGKANDMTELNTVDVTPPSPDHKEVDTVFNCFCVLFHGRTRTRGQGLKNPFLCPDGRVATREGRLAQ